MKFETFQLSDLFIKGEGNLHVVVLNSRSGQVYRFPKESKKDNETYENIDIENLDLKKLYKITINYKKYDVLQKFWGKEYLPKMKSEAHCDLQRVCLFPKQIIEQIAAYLESRRLESRRNKSIITRTSSIEIQPDLSLLPVEYNLFTTGVTYCVELKPKFGLLFQPKNNNSGDCRNFMSRFCIGQFKKTDKTNYCPCDIFSGNPIRMTRAIKSLIQKPQEKLRIFENGLLVSNIDNTVISRMVENLFPASHSSETESVDKFCNLVIQALMFDVSNTKEWLELPFDVTTFCQAHSWSKESDNNNNSSSFPQIYEGSVLGRLAMTSCLVDQRTEDLLELYSKLESFLIKHGIEKKENIFDLWNEHLLPLELPEEIIEIVHILKKFLVSLTVRDCSILIKFKKPCFDKLSVKQTNASILKQSDGSIILSMSDIIDISIKPLSKIKSNYQYEQELLKIFQ